MAHELFSFVTIYFFGLFSAVCCDIDIQLGVWICIDIIYFFHLFLQNLSLFKICWGSAILTERLLYILNKKRNDIQTWILLRSKSKWTDWARGKMRIEGPTTKAVHLSQNRTYEMFFASWNEKGSREVMSLSLSKKVENWCMGTTKVNNMDAIYIRIIITPPTSFSQSRRSIDVTWRHTLSPGYTQRQKSVNGIHWKCLLLAK